MGMPEPTLELTDEQIAFARENGYLALDAITTADELDWLREKYDRMFEMKAGREAGNQFDLAGTDEDDVEASLPQILLPDKYVPEFNETLIRANALKIIHQLFGEEGAQRGSHCIFKPPRVGAPTPWHQDEAYWRPDMEHHAVSIWVPLQEATVENGCMWFVPGSHRWDVLPHQHINNDPRIHGLELLDAERYTDNAVACPLPAGGATIHYSRTLHYTGPNVSDVPRRAYILGGGLPGKPLETPRRFPWKEEERSRMSIKRGT